FFDDLLMQLCIRGKGNVLFLHRGIGLYSRIIAVISIDPDTLLKDQLDARFADALAEMYQFGSLTRGRGYKFPAPTKILIIQVFRPLLHDALVRNIADVLQNQ